MRNSFAVTNHFPKDGFLFGDAGRLDEINIAMSEPCNPSNPSPAIGGASGLRQFAVLDVSNADHTDIGKQWFFAVKDHTDNLDLKFKELKSAAARCGGQLLSTLTQTPGANPYWTKGPAYGM